MKHVINIFWWLLYLTPIGYFFKLIDLNFGNYTPGVYVSLKRKSPIKAFVKKDPGMSDRLSWLVNSVFLLLQAIFITLNRDTGSFAATYAWFAYVFGIVTLVSTFSPNFPWNRKLPLIKLTTLDLLVIISLTILTGYITMPDSVIEKLRSK